MKDVWGEDKHVPFRLILMGPHMGVFSRNEEQFALELWNSFKCYPKEGWICGWLQGNGIQCTQMLVASHAHIVIPPSYGSMLCAVGLIPLYPPRWDGGTQRQHYPELQRADPVHCTW